MHEQQTRCECHECTQARWQSDFRSQLMKIPPPVFTAPEVCKGMPSVEVIEDPLLYTEAFLHEDRVKTRMKEAKRWSENVPETKWSKNRLAQLRDKLERIGVQAAQKEGSDD